MKTELLKWIPSGDGWPWPDPQDRTVSVWVIASVIDEDGDWEWIKAFYDFHERRPCWRDQHGAEVIGEVTHWMVPGRPAGMVKQSA